MAKLAAVVYGDALFAEALEKQQTDILLEEVTALQAIWRENAELAGLLDNPNVTKEEKLQIMENIFSGRVNESLMGFLMVIVEKGRQKDIPAICEYFIGTVKEYKKIGTAHVTSAIELDDGQKSRIEKKLLETTDYVSFEMDYNVDPAIIGGLVIRIGDRVADSSIRTQLYELRRSLSKLQLS